MVWFLHILNEHSTPSLVLQVHQFLSMFTLLRLMKEIFGKVLQSHIITVKVVRHGQVDRCRRTEVQVEVVDSSLCIPVVVLEHLHRGCGRHASWLRTGRGGGCIALELGGLGGDLRAL